MLEGDGQKLKDRQKTIEKQRKNHYSFFCVCYKRSLKKC